MSHVNVHVCIYHFSISDIVFHIPPHVLGNHIFQCLGHQTVYLCRNSRGLTYVSLLSGKYGFSMFNSLYLFSIGKARIFHIWFLYLIFTFTWKYCIVSTTVMNNNLNYYKKIMTTCIIIWLLFSVFLCQKGSNLVWHILSVCLSFNEQFPAWIIAPTLFDRIFSDLLAWLIIVDVNLCIGCKHLCYLYFTWVLFQFCTTCTTFFCV